MLNGIAQGVVTVLMMETGNLLTYYYQQRQETKLLMLAQKFSQHEFADTTSLSEEEVEIEGETFSNLNPKP